MVGWSESIMVRDLRPPHDQAWSRSLNPVLYQFQDRLGNDLFTQEDMFITNELQNGWNGSISALLKA